MNKPVGMSRNGDMSAGGQSNSAAAPLSYNDIVNLINQFCVQYVSQTLSQAQASQARANINAAAIDDLANLNNTLNEVESSLEQQIASVLNNNSSGGTLGGANYIYVTGKSNPSANATELQNAYNAATRATPYGNPLSTNNRFKIIIGPGNYAQSFTIGTPFIDLISLTGEADVYLNSIFIGCNDNFIKGINCGSGQFSMSSSLNLLVCENCIGEGDYSFGGCGVVSGTFKYCIGGAYSFGGSGGTASGTFIGCKGGGDSFGGGGTASGTFNGCTGGDLSFGGYGTASGTFDTCTGGGVSFGGGSGAKASGTFNYCIGGVNSFGGNCGTASGIFNHCTGSSYAFGGGGTASGIFDTCTGGDYSFGGANAASGNFVNCTGGIQSFGGAWSGNASGIFETCTGGNDSFGGCYGVASGTFIGCKGDAMAFGGGGTISNTALLYNCYLTSGAFCPVVTGGLLRNCLDGTKTIINT